MLFLVEVWMSLCSELAMYVRVFEA